MAFEPDSLRGRGAANNPANRFEALRLESGPESDLEPGIAPKTRFYRDASCSILTRNDSPDVGFDTSLNPYRGCEHGCIYCHARPTHEYLGFSAGLKQAADAGAQYAGCVVLRLPYALKELFGSWPARHFPLKKEKVPGRIRKLRGGTLNDSGFGSRMRGEGIFAEQIAKLFSTARRRAGLASGGPELSTAAFRRSARDQTELF